MRAGARSPGRATGSLGFTAGEGDAAFISGECTRLPARGGAGRGPSHLLRLERTWGVSQAETAAGTSRMGHPLGFSDSESNHPGLLPNRYRPNAMFPAYGYRHVTKAVLISDSCRTHGEGGRGLAFLRGLP